MTASTGIIRGVSIPRAVLLGDFQSLLGQQCPRWSAAAIASSSVCGGDLIVIEQGDSPIKRLEDVTMLLEILAIEINKLQRDFP